MIVKVVRNLFIGFPYFPISRGRYGFDRGRLSLSCVSEGSAP